MSISAREFDHLIRKFDFRTRNSGDVLAWLEVDGKVAVRTRRSKKASGDLPMQHSIRQQMKLSADQLRQAIQCTLDRGAYLSILQDKDML